MIGRIERLWGMGRDTWEIAKWLKRPEHAIYNLLAAHKHQLGPTTDNVVDLFLTFPGKAPK